MISVVKLGTTVLKLIVVLFIAYWFTQTSLAQTIPATELNGYAWSSTIGWISLNCLTGGVGGTNICGTSNYKVSINANRSVTGYAWSEHIGWIKFGGLSTFPTGGGTTATNTQVTVNGAFPNLTFNGWARACAGTNAPNTSEDKNCSTMVDNNNSGDWDGWISLDGTNYRLRTDTTGIIPKSGANPNDGYIWGGTVVGWIDMFSYVTWLNLNPAAYVIVPSCFVGVASSTCQSQVSWSIVNAVGTANLFNTTLGTINVAVATNSLTLQLGPNTFAARDGLVTIVSQSGVASCAAGLVLSGGLCQNSVSAVPAVSITANKRIARSGDTVRIDWTITPPNTNPAAITCTVSGPGMPTLEQTNSGNSFSAPLRSKSRFTITCTDTTTTNTDMVEVELIPTTREV